MSDLRKAAEMALEFMSWLTSDDHSIRPHKAPDIIEALRQALAQQDNHESLRLATKEYIQELEDRIDEYILKEKQQEPVAWMGIDSWGIVTKFRTNPFGSAIPLYKTPPQKEWVGLTDEEKEQATGWSVEHIEAKLKEKNGG